MLCIGLLFTNYIYFLLYSFIYSFVHSFIHSLRAHDQITSPFPPSLPPTLPQVAYDTGVRQFCVPGLGHLKDTSALLPDDVEWVLSSGVNEKSVRRLPAIEGVKAVYISTIDTALLLEEALRKVRRLLPSLPSFPPLLPLIWFAL